MNVRLAWLTGALAVIGFALICNGPAQGQGKDVTPAKAEISPLDQPLALLAEAKRNYGAVQDYTCTLVSQERVNGKLEDQNIMQAKFRTEPFSIYMRWLAPEDSVGQEVAFVLGKNNNKMRVKSLRLGKGGLLGWMSIDPNDPRATARSRHNILEAGIGNMIDQHITHWSKAKTFADTKVNIGEAKYNERDCVRVEVTLAQRNPTAYCYRSVLYMEKQSKLPIRMENYDWPQPNGAAGGEVLEVFSYVNLQFNVGLKNADFDR
jgi:hypothetical protein